MPDGSCANGGVVQTRFGTHFSAAASRPAVEQRRLPCWSSSLSKARLALTRSLWATSNSGPELGSWPHCGWFVGVRRSELCNMGRRVPLPRSAEGRLESAEEQHLVAVKPFRNAIEAAARPGAPKYRLAITQLHPEQDDRLALERSGGDWRGIRPCQDEEPQVAWAGAGGLLPQQAGHASVRPWKAVASLNATEVIASVRPSKSRRATPSTSSIVVTGIALASSPRSWVAAASTSSVLSRSWMINDARLTKWNPPMMKLAMAAVSANVTRSSTSVKPAWPVWAVL